MPDLRIAVRALQATPVVTAVAVLSLALGIGANTAIFSIADSLLLRTLPADRPDRLVLLVSNPAAAAVAGFSLWSNPVWEQIRERRHELFHTTLASARTTRVNLATGGPAEHAGGVWVSANYFDALGVRPILGRAFVPEDDRRGGGPDGAVAIGSPGFSARWRCCSRASGSPA
jgi:putative ABC transport system permease protein